MAMQEAQESSINDEDAIGPIHVSKLEVRIITIYSEIQTTSVRFLYEILPLYIAKRNQCERYTQTRSPGLLFR